MAKEKELSPINSLNNVQDPEEIVVRQKEEVEDYSEDVPEVHSLIQKKSQQCIHTC